MVQKRKSRVARTKKLVPAKKLKKKKVHCKFCFLLVPIEQAHRHDGGWVGPECWDERLRPTS